MADLTKDSLLLYINPGEDLKDAKACSAEDLQALIDTNTFLTSATIDPNAGTGSGTLSDGTPVAFTVAAVIPSMLMGPVVGADGASTYTHLGGDGTATPFTIPAGSVLSAPVTNPDGSTTYTHTAGGISRTITIPAPSTLTGPGTNAAGDTVYTHTAGGVDTDIVIPMDDLLGGLSLAADGCTMTGTLDDGTPVSVAFCDLVSDVTEVDNGDGSFTYTHSDGTTWTTPDVPMFMRKNATGNTVPAVAGDVFLSADAPFVARVECEDGVQNYYDCDGNLILCMSTRVDDEEIFTPFNGVRITEATVAGEVLNQSQDLDITVVKRNNTVMVEGNMGHIGQVDAGSGAVDTAMEYQITRPNGTTTAWRRMRSAGIQSARSRRVGEQSSNWTADSGPMLAGVNTFRFRIIATATTVPAGDPFQADPGAFNNFIRTHSCNDT